MPRSYYPTPIRPSDAPVLDREADNGGMAQFLAFDRVMQRILGAGVAMYDRKEEEKRYATDQARLGRAEQRGVEATAEEQRRYGQQQAYQQEGRDFTRLAGVVADPRLAALQRGGRLDQPGAPTGFESPLAWTGPEQPDVPRGIDIAEGPPQPTGYAPSRLAEAEQMGRQSQRQGAFSETGKLGMQIQTPTDLQAVFTEIDGKTEVPGGFTKPEADDIKARLAAAFKAQQDAAEAMRKATLAMQERASQRQSHTEPRLRISDALLATAFRTGDRATIDQGLKERHIAPIRWGTPEGDARAAALAADQQALVQQTVSKGDLAENKAHMEFIRQNADNIPVLQAYASENGLDATSVASVARDALRLRRAAVGKAEIGATGGPGSPERSIDIITKELTKAKVGFAKLRGSERKTQSDTIRSLEAELASLKTRKKGGEPASPQKAPTTYITPHDTYEQLNPVPMTPSAPGASRRAPKGIVESMSLEQLRRVLADPGYDQPTKDMAAEQFRVRQSGMQIPGGGR